MKHFYPSIISLLLPTLTQSQDYTFEWKYSLYAPYVNQEGHSANWNIDALINNHHHVVLTPDLPGKSGSVFTKQKFNSDDWFIETSFHIKAQNPRVAGDGMALWFVEDPFSPGTAFGHAEKFKGLGIFFDLYQNQRSAHRFPYISAMVNDGNRIYDHETDGKDTMLAGCHAKILNTETPVHAKLIYHNNILEMLLFLDHSHGWTPCFKVPNVKLPKSGYVGMTAITGDATAAHQLIGITTGSYSVGKSSDQFANADTEEHEETHALLFFIILGLVLVGAGYRYHQQNKKKSTF